MNQIYILITVFIVIIAMISFGCYYKQTKNVKPPFHAEKTQVIPTPLPIVYRYNNELVIKNGLEVPSSHVWGYQLSNGVVISMEEQIGFKDHSSVPEYRNLTWWQAKEIAETLTLNGKRGHLPSPKIFATIKDTEETSKICITLKIVGKYYQVYPYRPCIYGPAIDKPSTKAYFKAWHIFLNNFSQTGYHCSNRLYAKGTCPAVGIAFD